MGKSSDTIIMFPCFAQLEQGPIIVVSDVQRTNILIVSNFESNLDVNCLPLTIKSDSCKVTHVQETYEVRSL